MSRFACAGTLLLALCLLPGGPASAGASMRCGQSVIERGLELYEVIERCGEPVDHRSYIFYRGYDVGYFEMGPVQVDELIYEIGDNKFRRKLRFEDGRLMRIELLQKPLPG